MTSFIYEKYVDIDQFFDEAKQILKEYVCPLCGGVFNDPRADTCGHLFCKRCINLSLERSGGRCPLSDSLIKEDQLSEQKFVSNILNKQKLYCSNKTKGCSWADMYQNLSYHLEYECLKQELKCKNNGCLFVSAKENISAHLEICEFRVVNCLNCFNLLAFNLLEQHYSICPNVLVDCDKNCRRKVERKCLDSHINNECENTEIICMYYKFGCIFKSERKNLKIHLEKEFSYHQMLILKEVLRTNELLKEKVFELENDNNKICSRLVTFEKKLEEVQTHKFVYKAKDNSLLNKKTTREETKCVEIPELQNDKEETVVESKTNDKADDKTDLFDLNNLPTGIVIDHNKICSEPSGKKNSLHKFVFGSAELNNSEIKWRIRVVKISHWFGFGVCQKERTISGGYKFFKGNKEKETSHGTFLYSSNGYSWNGNQIEEDNVALKNFTQPKSGDTIFLHYKLKSSELVCQINNSTFRLSKVNAGNDKLVPCFIFLFSGDEVRIEF